jgi:DEAD/DEAH box helicase domain-containing protein
MTKLQAATVSNRVIHNRKRKRAEPDAPEAQTGTGDDTQPNNDGIPATSQSATATSVPTKTHDGGQKPKRTPKKGEKPTLKRKGSSTIIETSIPWPEPLTKLAQTHKALNLVYTNIKRELSINDVAKISFLCHRSSTSSTSINTCCKSV